MPRRAWAPFPAPAAATAPTPQETKPVTTDEGKDEGKHPTSADPAAAALENSPKLLVQKLLLDTDRGVEEHVRALRTHREAYLFQLTSMMERQVTQMFSTNSKARVLAALFALKEREALDACLADDSFTGLAEMVKAVQLLDAPRRIRQILAKVARLEAAGVGRGKVVKASTLANLRNEAANLSKDVIAGAVSGSGLGLNKGRCNRVRKWVLTLPRAKLEFFLLNYPTDKWRELADVCHFRPSDFKLEYFTKVMFGAPAPADSLVAVANTVTHDNVEALLAAHPRLAASCWSFLRKRLHTGRDAKAVAENKVEALTAMGFTRNQARIAIANVGGHGGGGRRRNFRRGGGRGGRGGGGRGRVAAGPAEGLEEAAPRPVPFDATACVDWLLEHMGAVEGMAPPAEETNEDFTEGAKVIIARLAPLDTLVWWYHELECPAVENAIYERLAAGEQLVSLQMAEGKAKEMAQRAEAAARTAEAAAVAAAEGAPAAAAAESKDDEAGEEEWDFVAEVAGPAPMAPGGPGPDAPAPQANGEEVVEENAAAAAPAPTLAEALREAKAGKADVGLTAEALASRAEAAAGAAAGARVSYGKLLERLIGFREKGVKFAELLLPQAEKQLAVIKRAHALGKGQQESAISVAVLGDSSGSMQVAIKCAASLGSLLSTALQAQLVLFHEEPYAPCVEPRTARTAIQVVEETAAQGGTCMAAPLWAYYERKERVDLLVLVSDEGENQRCNGFTFAELFVKYRAEVAPHAKVVLVSFLDGKEPGVVNTRLKAAGVDVTQLRLDAQRPDTSKFDSLLGLVTLERAYFEERAKTVKGALPDLHKDELQLVLGY